MMTLALESSTSLGSVALAKDGIIQFYDECFKQRSHSEFMNSALRRGLEKTGLKLEQISQIAVSKGPGSFTGLRVSGGIAKSFSFSLQKPIWSVGTLQLLKAQFDLHLPAEANQQVFICMNAFKNMAYCSAFDRDLQILQPTVVNIDNLMLEAERLFAKERPLHILGDIGQVTDFGPDLSVKRYPDLQFIHPRADTLAVLSHKNSKLGSTCDWKSFLPLYLRASEAEENLRLRR